MSAKCFCLSLVSALALLSSLSNGDTNLLTNPGFETGDTTGWIPRGCPIKTVTDPAHGGDYSAKAYDKTDTWQGIEQNIMGLINDGQTCTISGWVRLENVSGASVIITVQQEDGRGTNWHRVSDATGSDDFWSYLSGDFTLDVNGVLTALSVYFECSVADANFFVDDASLTIPGVDPNQATGTIDANTLHQEIEGFGAAGAWYEGWLTAHPQKDEIYDVLFGQLGLDIYRLRNTYDHPDGDVYMNNSAEIVASGEATLGRPLKIMISSWSPPAYLKSNDSTTGGDNATLDGGPSSYVYSQFASWWADSITAWSSYGVDADYINIQNECDYDASWDSCRFEPQQTTSIAGYDEAFEAVYNEMYSRFGSSMPKMLAAETAGMDRIAEYLSYIINPSHLYGYAHHLYNCYGDGDSTPGCGSDPDRYLARMTNFVSQYGDKPRFQTEYEFSTGTWTDAMNTALLLHNSLTIEQVSAYIYWDLFWGDNGGLVTLDNPWQPDPGYTINPVYYAFKHYSAFIHSGWQRLETSVDSFNPRMSAYIGPDGRQLTVVIINTSFDIDVEFDLSFCGLPLEDSDVYRSSETESCVLVGGLDPANPMTLPTRSITTIALWTGTPPVADAGPNDIAYAFIDGWADVNLDGSGSYDDDGDPLSYYWSWNIDGNDYEANGVSPAIRLPVGEHTITLVVDDGIVTSGPNCCTINVIPPLDARLLYMPSNLDRRATRGRLLALVSMPPGVYKAEVNMAVLPTMYPIEVKAQRQFVFGSRYHSRTRTHILTWFKKSQCIEKLHPGINEVTVVGKLTSGRYYRADGRLWLLEKRQHFWQPFYREWRKWRRRWYNWRTNEF